MPSSEFKTNIMKQKFLLAFGLFCFMDIFSQSPRTVVVEHFSNTRCSICASRNPSFYSVLANYPQVLHITYHPSAPYSQCYFNLQNVSENDARTNYYNTYGSTPDYFLNGKQLPAANPAINNAILDTALNQTSPVEIIATEELIGNDSVKVKVVVRTTGVTSVSTVRMFAGVAENPINYNAQNGETVHHDVFRKTLTAAVGNQFALPALNDSAVFEFTYVIKNGWSANNIYTLALIQRDDTKEVLNAAKSTRVVSTSVGEIEVNQFSFFPNPVLNELQVSGYSLNEKFSYSILDLAGRKVKEQTFDNRTIDVSELQTGIYFLRIEGRVKKFIKE